MDANTPVNLSVARAQFGSIIERVQTERRPVYLARRGQRIAAVIAVEDLDRLIELAEDMADIRAAAEAREEMLTTQQEPIPWDEVKQELGLG